MPQKIQYQLSDDTWSNWTAFIVDDGKIVADGQLIEASCFRVIKGVDDRGNPMLAWYALHEGQLYEVSKTNRNQLNKATPLNKTLRAIGIEKLPPIFTHEAFDDMLASAKDFLAPPLLTVANILELLIRPADQLQTRQLLAPETIENLSALWWKDLYEKYTNDVQQQLLAICNQQLTRRQQIQALITFLDKHHQFIQETCLHYFAIPNHPVTMALSHIAEKLEQDTGMAAIKLLLPGIADISSKDNALNLSERPLYEVFQSHIALTPQYLLPVSSLKQYIADPVEPIYSPYWLEEDLIPYPASPEDIQTLFEHSETTLQLRDAYQAYQTLSTQEDTLLGQLTLLGQKLKNYDAHGGIGRQDSAGNGAYAAIKNFMEYYLSLETCYLRLNTVAPVLSDLPESTNLGYILFENKLYFLNRYKQEIIQISSSDHHAKFGIHLARFPNRSAIPFDIKTPIIVKTDDEQYTFFPGEVIIDARMIDLNFPQEIGRIIHLSASNIPHEIFEIIQNTGFQAPRFSQLFKEKFSEAKYLNTEELAFIDIHTGHSFLSGYTSVPEPLRQEIELLWQLSHNPAKNIDATRNFATCIGTRGENIRALIKSHQVELIQIGMRSEIKVKILKTLSDTLDKQLQALETTAGSDKHLGLNERILKHYHKSIAINSFVDCYQLSAFNPRDLKIILETNPTLLKNLIEQLDAESQNNYIVYFSDLPLAIMEVIFPLTISIVKNNLNRLSMLLSILGPEKINLIISQLPDIIQNGGDFFDVTDNLSEAQYTQVLQQLKNEIPNFIKTAEDFFHVMSVRAPSKRELFFQFFQKYWHNIIKNGEDFNLVILNLTAAQRRDVMDSFSDYWHTIIKSGRDFNLTIRHLDDKERQYLMEKFKGHWHAIILSGKDYALATHDLNEAQRATIFADLKHHWPMLIKDDKDLENILRNLSCQTRNEECALIIEELKETLPQIISKPVSFLDAIRGCCPSIQIQIIKALHHHIRGIMAAPLEVKDMINYLRYYFSTEAWLVFIETLQDHWIHIIQQRKVQNTLQETITCFIRSQDFHPWQHIPELMKPIHDLAEGIQELSTICHSYDIETFLAAIMSQEPEQIQSSFEKLFCSQGQEQSFFTSTSNNEKQILKIVHDKFPLFCTRHLLTPMHTKMHALN